jgi:hypothetical protein
MAEVWEGQDATLRRAVAIKVLQTHLASDATFVERFRREAVTAARVAHPCVVATYDAGVDAGTAYIVMELVDGQTLRQLLTASAPLAPGLAVAIAQQIADALANAHRAGLVHRDIKPANILLCDDGAGALRVKVTDFGIAKVGAELGNDLTQIGTVLGTPKYLSPEQVEGRVEPDARSDLYALGVVLFEMLTGRPPFNGPTAMATALAHLRDPPPHVSSLRPEISAGLDAFVDQLLAKSPADRPPTAIAARQHLDGLVRQGLVARPGSGPPVVGARADTTVIRGSGDGADPVGDSPPPALHAPVGHAAWERTSASAPPGRPASSGGTRVLGAAPAVAPPRRTQPSPPGERAGVAATTGSHRRGRFTGLVVAAIVLLAVIVGAILIANHGGADRKGAAGAATGPDGTTTTAAAAVRSVNVWMNTTAHPPDNASQTGNAFDAKTSTVWQTDQYRGFDARHFGGLYTGEGLAIHLTGTGALTRLEVESTTRGWAASTYVASTEPSTGSPVSAWGTPTASKTDIDGNVTFELGGRKGSWVLLWLTDLGPSARASIAEVTVS